MIMDIVALGITFWLVIGAVLVANGFFAFQVRMARYRVMQTLAEKGQPVPPEMFSGSVGRAPVGMLRAGIVLVCLGVALGLFFWSMTSASIFAGPIKGADWLPTIALFPLLMGVALLLMALIERRRPH